MSILLPRCIVTLLRYVSIELKELLTYLLTYSCVVRHSKVEQCRRAEHVGDLTFKAEGQR